MTGSKQMSVGLCVWTLGLQPNPILRRFELPLTPEGRIIVDASYRVKIVLEIVLISPIHSKGEEWVQRLMIALMQNNVNSVLSLFAEDVVLISNGGGKAFATTRPIESPERVTRFLLGLIQKASSPREDIQIELISLNRQTGVVVRKKSVIQTVMLIHVKNNAIRNIYFVRNPDKLQRI